MAEKILNTRIQLKYDTYANWTTNNPILKKGEMAIATIEAGNTEKVNSVTPPQVLIKVGDGKTNYNALPFVSGLAADVYSWAKKNDTEFISWLNTQIGNTYDTLIEGLTDDGNYYYGRSYMDIPDEDGLIFIKADKAENLLLCNKALRINTQGQLAFLFFKAYY